MSVYSKKSGFTIIELIVVVSIIGILAAVITVNFNESRAGVRDTERAVSLEQLQLALELYKDTYGQYPDQGCTGPNLWAGPGPHPGGMANSCSDYIVGHTSGVNFVPDFIAELPTDPRNEDEDNTGFMYRVEDVAGVPNAAYKVLVYETVEVDQVNGFDHPLARCPYDTGSPPCTASTLQNNVYAVYSAGGEEW
jgi:prepilin-type N-terminal cleavage/methylation domain-containing protein